MLEVLMFLNKQGISVVVPGISRVHTLSWHVLLLSLTLT